MYNEHLKIDLFIVDRQAYCRYFLLLYNLFSDAIQGHDPLDSTTVRREIKPVHLDEEGSISGLHIGIPKVGMLHRR